MEKRLDKLEYLIGMGTSTYLMNEIKLLRLDIELQIKTASLQYENRT